MSLECFIWLSENLVIPGMIMRKKIGSLMLLGSGELGKEFVIAVKRLGEYVVAVDSYNDAPAQQVADEREVINMLDGSELDRIVANTSLISLFRR
jgi:formate-dependent phosphoribosylglycinamide formyltransferase (GAR transformylase)